MCSRFLRFGGVLTLAAVCAAGGRGETSKALRICADPDNPPFSMRSGQGFDNRIAVLLARDLGREPVFVWSRARRGFLREQFNKGACDVLMGIPQGLKAVMTTEPYYRSSYVFVTRAKDHLQIASFNDPQIDKRRIGLQILEEDYSPPSLPLIRSGHAGQLVGFPSFGADAGDIVSAVVDGRIGMAVVWGPLAGYFAARMRSPVSLVPVSPQVDQSGVPFTFSLTVGVHKRDVALREALDSALERQRAEIGRILHSYHVPQLPQGGAS